MIYMLCRVAIAFMVFASTFVSAQSAVAPLHRFNIDELSEQNAATELPYLEFIREDTMSGYIYELAADTVDEQEPHDQDEIYYVVSGRSSFTVESKTISIEPGDILFVRKFAEHRFSEIAADLKLLVIFAPPDTE